MLIDWTEKNYPIGTLVIIFQKLPLGDTSQGTPLETEFKKRSWIQRNSLKKPYNTSISQKTETEAIRSEKTNKNTTIKVSRAEASIVENMSLIEALKKKCMDA